MVNIIEKNEPGDFILDYAKIAAAPQVMTVVLEKCRDDDKIFEHMLPGEMLVSETQLHYKGENGAMYHYPLTGLPGFLQHVLKHGFKMLYRPEDRDKLNGN